MLIEITLRQCKYMSFQKEAQFMTCMYSMLIQHSTDYISMKSDHEALLTRRNGHRDW